MKFHAFGARLGPAAVTATALLLVVVLVAQVVPGGPLERLLAAIDEWGVAYPPGPIR